MATNAEQIATIKTQTLQLIVDITENPKPTYMIEGQSVQWGQYLRDLQATVAWCDQQLNSEQPFEFETRIL